VDDFREWLSDNLRYILLGMAVILVLVIAFFAVRLVTEKLGDGNNDPINLVQNGDNETEGTSEQATEGMTAAGTEQTMEAPDSLQTENSVILEFVQKFYNAIANKNIEEYQLLCESVDEETIQYILNSPIESYNNIKVYFRQGLTDTSYFVYPYYEAKLPGIEQLAPGLTQMYLDTREDGSLYAVAFENHAEIQNAVMEDRYKQDVQDLANQVDRDFDALKAANPNLDALLAELKEPETEIDIPEVSTVDESVNKSVTVTGNLNVRSDSRQDSELLGSLIPGMTVTRTQVLDNGWSKIRFDDGAGTILEGYVLSEYLEE